MERKDKTDRRRTNQEKKARNCTAGEDRTNMKGKGTKRNKKGTEETNNKEEEHAQRKGRIINEIRGQTRNKGPDKMKEKRRRRKDG